jgi:hypothetical protein
MMTTPRNRLITVLIAALPLGVAACGSSGQSSVPRSAATTSPATSTAATVAPATEAPTTVVPTTITTPAQPTTDLTGTYTATATKDQLMASGVAAGFSKSDLSGLLDLLPAAKSIAVTIKLADGGWSQTVEADGAPADGWGSRGTYHAIDERTVNVIDECNVTYSYVFTHNQLTLKVADDHTCADYGERMANAMLYQTAPFKMVAAASSTPSPSTSTFTTQSFGVSFQIELPSWLTSPPDTEEANFMTWSANDSDRAVRMLLPVSVYPPGATTPTPVPTDYLSYLNTLSNDGVHLDDRSTITVDGHPGTLLTMTTDHSIDGALGCPAADMTPADCYGVQPTVSVRFAVIDLGNRVMLSWLRNINGVDSTAKNASFEQMLQSIHFQS